MKMNNLFYNPFQGFWNGRIIKSIHKRFGVGRISKILNISIIVLDTVYLSRHYFYQRRKSKSFSTINYFDLGTHRQGLELQAVSKNILETIGIPYRIYSFEANIESYNKAKEVLKDVKYLRMNNLALVNSDVTTVRLFVDESGLGDSVYRDSNLGYLDVKAQRLSQYIHTNQIDLKNSFNILRMNIEGSEYDVLRDLDSNNYLCHMNLFLGMWDDLEKINYSESQLFLSFLDNKKIKSIPLNGRDLKYSFRTKLIMGLIKRRIKQA